MLGSISCPALCLLPSINPPQIVLQVFITLLLTSPALVERETSLVLVEISGHPTV